MTDKLDRINHNYGYYPGMMYGHQIEIIMGLSKEELNKLKTKCAFTLEVSEEEFNNLCRNACLQKYTQEELDNPTEEMKEYIFNTALSFVLNKQVWFMICESYGEYYIAMYYDNVYNQANGEDL